MVVNIGYRSTLLLTLLLGVFAVHELAVAEASGTAVLVQDAQVFAKVNSRVITLQEFDTLYAATLRQRSYHGNVQEGQPEAVRKEVTELLVDRVLLLEDAERRGLKPDAVKIEKEVAVYDARYASSPRWQQQREQMLPGVRAQLAKQSLLEQMEKVLREVPPPAQDEVRAYYDQHNELFTEPEKLRLSLILLKVDPSSPVASWDQAREEALAIYQRIKKGADFSEAARLHSNDASAAKGGDLGYVHRGMLPEATHEKIDMAKLGEVSEPITTLEGVALIRLDERVLSSLRVFSDVEKRASELLVREREALAKKDALVRLRSQAKIEILTPMAGEKDTQ